MANHESPRTTKTVSRFEFKVQPMSRVYTASSLIHGTGVFSAILVSPGEIVLSIDDSRVVTDADPLDMERGDLMFERPRRRTQQNLST